MRAREYYQYLLRKNGYEIRQPLTDTQRNEWVERLKKRWPNLGEEEISQQMKEAADTLDSGRVFDALTEDILNHIPEEFEKQLPDGFVGELPINDFNGQSRITPSGEYLILINKGLTASLHQWAKLVISVLFVNPEDKEKHLQNVATVLRYTLMIYLKTKKVPSFPMYTEASGSTLSTVLGMSASHFVLAHEFSHILLGHCGQENATPNKKPNLQSWKTRLSSIWRRFNKQDSFNDLPEPFVLSSTDSINVNYARRSWTQELNADQLALTLLLKDIDHRPLHASTEYNAAPHKGKNRFFDIEATLAGIGFLFGLLRMLDLLHLPEMVQSHPPSWARWQRLETTLNAELDMNQYGFANAVGNVMNQMIAGPPSSKVSSGEPVQP
jgi:hypothetical protein